MNKLKVKSIQVELVDEKASEAFAECLVGCIFLPAILTFSGEIGAGKTTLIRALLRHLGVKGSIKSPTFSLVESYLVNHLPIHHFDLYRIQEEAELDYIGFRDYFEEDALCCIEWPERAVQSLSDCDLQFTLTLKGSGRFMSIVACSAAGETMLSCLAGKQ